MLKELRKKEFANGTVYALETDDGYPLEVTDTFLPFYTKECINGNNILQDSNLGSREERWMIGVSCQSGCPVGCKFCATGKLTKYRNLTSEEIINQVLFAVNKNLKDMPHYFLPFKSKEFKINYTRMGEPFLNIKNVIKAINFFKKNIPNSHNYISTIGLKGSDFSWIEGNITLQISLHSLDEKRRQELIPVNNLMSLEELGQIRTKSYLKTTLNLTLVDEEDFDIEKLKKYFDPEYFFIKLSPINKNFISEKNNMGDGIIKTKNII